MSSLLEFLSLEPLDLPFAVFSTLLFYFLFKSLETNLFKPFQEQLKRRELATAGTTDAASEKLRTAKQLEQSYESQVAAARITASARRDSILKTAEKESALTSEQAQVNFQKKVAESRNKLNESLNSSRARIVSLKSLVAGQIVDKIKQTLSSH